MYVGFAGQTCIYRHGTNVPLAEMGPIETNFLDALEVANGPIPSLSDRFISKSGRRAEEFLDVLDDGGPF
jgi:hypothetical protein